MTANQTPKFVDWLSLRSKLNHDWLQVRFLTALDALESRIDNNSDENEILEISAEIQKQWNVNVESLDAFIDEANEVCNPVSLLSFYPFSLMGYEDKNLIRESVENAYFKHSGLPVKFTELRKCYLLVDGLISNINTIPIKNIYTHVAELSRLISSLPSKVWLP